ncbi:MAG: 3-dehydroquinate synthase [Candidatus Zixiibacteriota bacterium]
MRPSLRGVIPARSLPVYVQEGILDKLPELLKSAQRYHRCELVTDHNVDAILGERLVRCLRRAGWTTHKTVLPAGERIKSERTIKSLHDAWFDRGVDRYTTVIALGGGTIGDATGYAAATFMRGVPLWQVPTTIIGQVDSALGGKVGINHQRGKNLIGAFYQPSGVVIDPMALRTLPPRERRSGLAEVIKYGVIADAALFRRCEGAVDDWLAGDTSIPTSTLLACVRIKLRVVEADEADHGLRHHLNFGHTLGHAIERWGGYRRYKHGEAVAMGMVAAGWMAHQRRRLTAHDFARLEQVCRKLYPPRITAPERLSDISQYLQSDKKRMAGTLRWVLPRGIGRVGIVDDVASREINGALRYALSPERR